VFTNPYVNSSSVSGTTPCHLDGCARSRRRGLERRERKDEDPLGRSRADRHAGAPEPAIEQELDDEATERVADEHRRFVERRDLRFVVIDDLRQAQALELVGRVPQVLDVSFLARPFRRRNGIPALGEVAGELLPAPSREPRPVDEHEGRESLERSVEAGRSCFVPGKQPLFSHQRRRRTPA